MVGERVEIHIEELIWEDDVVAKVTEKHGLEPQEAESILENQPMFFKNLPGFDRLATHIVIGRSHTAALFRPRRVADVASDDASDLNH